MGKRKRGSLISKLLGRGSELVKHAGLPLLVFVSGHFGAETLVREDDLSGVAAVQKFDRHGGFSGPRVSMFLGAFMPR